MKGLVIPLAMALVGAGAGGGAAVVLRPGAPEAAADAGAEHGAGAEDGHGAEKGAAPEAEHAGDGDGAKPEGDHGAGSKGGHGSKDGGESYFKINNQFVVPIIEDGRTEALVMMTLALDVPADLKEKVPGQEPKLRHALLRVMFDHANAGGFSGGFTSDDRVEPLRRAMLEQARAILGPNLSDVLILDLIRQDV